MDAELAERLGFCLERPSLSDIKKRVRHVMVKAYDTPSGQYLATVLVDKHDTIIDFRFYRVQDLQEGELVRIARLPREVRRMLEEDLNRCFQSSLERMSR